VEAAARAALPKDPAVNLQDGFDVWMEEIRKNPSADPDAILKRMDAKQIEAIARQKATSYARRVAAGTAAESIRTRSVGDPLRPRLAHSEWRDGITIHYEKAPPSAEEIAQAKALQKRTGEEIHLFGDTPAGQSYPGIDGTIGDPPRPLSLKQARTGANAGAARAWAQRALEAAREHGYSHVEVQIEVTDHTVAEVKAAWETPPGKVHHDPLKPYFDSAGTVERIVIKAKDGVWEPLADIKPKPGLAIPHVPGDRKDGPDKTGGPQ
jgi:hypothetical protein